jgi:polyhydroxyalkanoate synthesis regulator phasin
MPQPKSSRASSTRTRKPAAARATPSAAATKAEAAAHDNLRSLRDMLRRGAVVTQDHVKEALDEAVKAGRLTRKEATDVARNVVAAGRKQADGFRKDIDQVVGHGRSRAAKSGVLREVDRARRRAGVGPSFPISMYDELNATQVQARLSDLTPAQLRKVRDYERRHRGRKSVLSAIERKLR